MQSKILGKINAIAGITIVLIAIGLRQHFKFTNGNGLFYYISPRHGDWILGACLLLMYVAGLSYLLKRNRYQ